MRLIPSAINPSTSSDAERRVFDLLKHTDPEPAWRAYHSLNLAEHEYKRVGELDFVVLGPSGVLVLEVKGGGVSLRDGVWRFKDRFGIEHRRSEGPFQQARSGMFALERRLKMDLGDDVTSGITFGFAVIFTDCSFKDRSVEWADETVLDADGLRGQSSLSAFLARAYRYWAGKRPHCRVLDSSTLNEVAAILRPDFDRVPSLRHRAEAIDSATDRLTDEQYSRLDIIEDNPRILVSGGAGTGKTFLATELARRHASRGERVLLVTPGAILAAFVRSRIRAANVRVASAAEVSTFREKYDVLVVDEGQDMLNFEQLDNLDRLLKGGLATGCWRIFFDANKQTGLVGWYDPQSVELLKSYGAVPVVLRINCRNTRQITAHTKLLTAADLGTPSAGDGPRVGVAYYASESDQASRIDAELQRLLNNGVSKGDITILSHLPITQSSVQATDAYQRGQIFELDEETAENWPADEVTFATVSDFKGLENRFILVVDIDALDDSERDVNLLYVGMSRARAGLWIAVHRRLERRMDEITRANLARVVEDLQADTKPGEYA